MLPHAWNVLLCDSGQKPGAIWVGNRDHLGQLQLQAWLLFYNRVGPWVFVSIFPRFLISAHVLLLSGKVLPELSLTWGLKFIKKPVKLACSLHVHSLRKVQNRADLGREKTERWNAKLQAIRIKKRKGLFQREKRKLMTAEALSSLTVKCFVSFFCKGPANTLQQ